MSSLFVGLTPLHIITSVCSEERRLEDLVVLIDQTGGLFDFYEAVRNSGLIYNLCYIDASKSWQRLLSFLFSKRGLISTVFEEKIKKLQAEKYRDVYVFNDLSPEVQLILNRVEFSNAHYIEDGSAAYNSHFIRRGYIKSMLLKSFFSGFYDPINVIGTSKYIFDGFYSYPDSVRKENRLKGVKKLVYRKDYKDCLRRISDYYKELFGIASDGFEKCIIFVPKDQSKCVANLIEDAKLKAEALGFFELKYIVKFHPLLSNDFEEELLGREDVILCPKDLPGELLPEIYGGVALVLGEGSTILMNIRKMYREVTVINVSEVCSSPYDRFLDEIGVLSRIS